jgi:chromate transporter
MLTTLKLYFHLVFEFFQIGIFSFGGGYATLPFLLNISQKYHWYTPQDLSQMIAVASITPGPVGINVATYAGLKVGGLFTAFLGTAAEVLPAFFIVIVISKLLKKYNENYYVKTTLSILKPTACALLTTVVLKLIKETLLTTNPNQLNSIILFLGLLPFVIFKKKDVLWYITVSAIIGIVFVKFNYLVL